MPSADSSTGNSSTRLNTTGNNSSNSASRTAPTDFQDLDLE
jgi:hypothetical protein